MDYLSYKKYNLQYKKIINSINFLFDVKIKIIMNVCSKCNKIFSSSQCLQYHTSKNVCGKKTNVCEKCLHKFKTKAMLKYHLENSVCEKKNRKKIVLKPDLCQNNENKKISLKKELMEKYENYTKDELILKIADFESSNTIKQLIK